jgi:precorrin-6A synthase
VRSLALIGIGAGDPNHLTLHAIEEICRTDVVFTADKGERARDLAAARDEVLRRSGAPSTLRVVNVVDPERDRGSGAYAEAVEDWRMRRADAFERAIVAELGESQRGAILVWGDPSLYDSMIAVADDIRARGNVALELTVVPGISSVQALAAAHRIALNRVGRPVHITPARLLEDGLPDGADDVVVMLDSGCTFERITEPGVEIYWGAYLGTAYELLVSGPLDEVAAEVRETRERARKERGWIMDTYLLRRRLR